MRSTANATPEITQLDFSIISRIPGRITLSSINFLFHNMLPCRQLLAKRGKRLFSTKQERLEPSYAKDDSLTIQVISSRPRLCIDWQDPPQHLLEGECHHFGLTLTNKGQNRVTDLEWIAGEDGYITFVSSTSSNRSDDPGKLTVINGLTPDAPLLIPGLGNGLDPGQSLTLALECNARGSGFVDIPVMIKFAQGVRLCAIDSGFVQQLILYLTYRAK